VSTNKSKPNTAETDSSEKHSCLEITIASS